MQYKQVAQDFFKLHLPKDLRDRLDLDSLNLRSGSYIDSALRESISDLVFDCTLAGENARIAVLVEHQSTPDAFLPLRVHYYLLGMALRFSKEKASKAPKKSTRKPPAIYAMVLYHGKETPYPYSLDIFDNFEDAKGIMPETLYKPIHLIDLNQVSDEALKHFQWIGPLELTMKYARATNQEIQHAFSQIADLLAAWPFSDQNEHEMFAAWVTYILKAMRSKESSEGITIEGIFSELPNEKRKAAMNLAEALEQNGFNKGMKQGIERGFQAGGSKLLLNLVEKRFGQVDEATKLRIESASSDQLERWSVNILSASTLAEFFGEGE